jgi:hypothetical protein
MSDSKLKLWNCYQREDFTNNDFEEYYNSESDYEFENEKIALQKMFKSDYENFQNANYQCVQSNSSLENFEDMNSESCLDSISQTVNDLKYSIFGNSAYADFYFYGGIAIIIYVIILSFKNK